VGTVCGCNTLELEGDDMSIHAHQKRKTLDWGNLSECLCGLLVSAVQKQAGVDIIQCKKAGCEMEWVHTQLSCHCHWKPDSKN
jgi:hypothetical protein